MKINPVQKHLLLSLLALLCLPHSGQASAVGQPVPKGTAAGQYLIWSLTANNGFGGWVQSSSILSNGTEVAIGGAVDSTSRLAVNPSGTAENGITVTMPSSSTGNALQAKNANGTFFSVSPNATEVLSNTTSQSALLLQGLPNTTDTDYLELQDSTGGTPGSNPYWYFTYKSQSYSALPRGLIFSYYTGSSYTSPFSISTGGNIANSGNINAGGNVTASGSLVCLGTLTGGSYATTSVPLTLKGASGQTADLLDLNSSTNANLAKVDKNGDFITTGYINSPTYQVSGTPGYTGTIPSTNTGVKVVSGIVTGYYNMSGTLVGN